jgi:cytidine deaminase
MKPELLIQKAIEATKDCHVPYSKFKVGAAILMKDGTIVTGANIENSSYGLSMCAERTALYHAHLKGFRKADIVSMAIIGPTAGPISPCGACRQVMHELMDAKTPIYLSNLNKEMKLMTPETLLPYAFSSKDLKS